jgi:hypothetical protein
VDEESHFFEREIEGDIVEFFIFIRLNSKRFQIYSNREIWGVTCQWPCVRANLALKSFLKFEMWERNFSRQV